MNAVFAHSNYILGEEVKTLEKEMARYLKVKYAVGVNSGTDALFLALKACGIKEGDEVITSAFGYIASVLGISFCGAKPVLVDADPRDYNINTALIEKAITKKTKAILPVHLYGQTCNMPEIMRIARKYRLKVVEDCAQAHGARQQMTAGLRPADVGRQGWQMAGAMGEAGCFSFYPTKNLGAYGDGGMVVTNNAKIYQQLLLLRDYGRRDRYQFAIKGYNSRLDELQAAVLRVKLKHLDSWNRQRRSLAQLYREKSTNRKIVLPMELPGRRHVYHLFVARSQQRKKLQGYLAKNGVGTAIHYPIPLHLQEAYRDLGYQRGDFPQAEKLAREVVSLPLYPELRPAEVKMICRKLAEYKE
jgi:dTDP-4-amino-4,6-dideoxygalactose transaminase